MKKIFYLFLAFFLVNNNVSAIENITWISNEKLKKWEVTIEDIPWAIISITEFLISIAGWIAIIFIIVWAYKYLFWSLEWNSDKWKETIFMAIVGLIIASCAYLIIKLVVNNFA